ncbi:MAG: carboxypeptidase regulatory-like domain-containing protein [Candidatus Dormibacteraeota bacterium]|nr:carboxypeptidase regulatory-like domain-containing protein [Candidatus Dormibacteraeota bacterium]MBV9526657.1 carboxypeptidase regulatory-like domain-containing protein [Candidatus Dormibacteraeota bacterium]
MRSQVALRVLVEAEYARPRRGLAVMVCLGAVVAGVLGAGLGAAGETRVAAQAARTASGAGDFGIAVAIDNALALRTGPAFVLDRGDVDSAARTSQATLLTWAAALAHGGHADQAAVLLASVTDPGLAGSAASEQANLLLDAARHDAASGDYAGALQRLDEVSRLRPPAAAAAQVAALMPQYEVGEAGALTAAGHGSDAVALLDSAASEPGAAPAVAGALPAALLAAGREQLALLSYKEAAATLQRLVQSYAGTPQARAAQQLLRAGQPVTGTLTDKSGQPVSAQVRLSTHFFTTPSGYYTTGPFYYATSDSDGEFTVPSVPVGGPYTFEILRGGGWTTFVDPVSGQPAMPVTVTPLVPVDMAFIALS